MVIIGLLLVVRLGLVTAALITADTGHYLWALLACEGVLATDLVGPPLAARQLEALAKLPTDGIGRLVNSTGYYFTIAGPLLCMDMLGNVSPWFALGGLLVFCVLLATDIFVHIKFRRTARPVLTVIRVMVGIMTLAMAICMWRLASGHTMFAYVTAPAGVGLIIVQNWQFLRRIEAPEAATA